MEYSVCCVDAWNVKHARPFSGRVIGVDSVKDAAVKWLARFYDKDLKVDSVTSRSASRSGNVTMVTLNCEGGKTFFLYVF